MKLAAIVGMKTVGLQHSHRSNPLFPSTYVDSCHWLFPLTFQNHQSGATVFRNTLNNT